MKRLFIIITILTLLTSGIVIAGTTYTAITPDNTVGNINVVRVRETHSRTEVDRRILTLRRINLKIQKVNAHIAALQAKKAELQALKVLVQVEADKIVLLPE